MAIIKRGKKWKVEISKKGSVAVYKTFDDKLEAQRFEAEQKLLARDPSAVIKHKLLDDAFKRYAAEISVKKAGERWEIIRLKKFSRDPFALLPISLITVDDINSWITQRSKTLKPNSILRELNLLSNVFEYAIKWRWCFTNPVRQADKPKVGKHRTRRISDDELSAILEALEYSDDIDITMGKQAVAIAFLLAIETGMRQGEIYSLTWNNVHSDKSFVHLSNTKNGDARDVPLSPRAIFLLEKMQGQHMQKGDRSKFCVREFVTT